MTALVFGMSLTTTANVPHGTPRKIHSSGPVLGQRDRLPLAVDLHRDTLGNALNRAGSGPMTAVLRVFTHGFAIGGDTTPGIVITVDWPLIVIVICPTPGPGVTVMDGGAPAGP